MDTERIKDKLSELLVYIAELDEDIPDAEDEYLEERRTRRACERTFQLACENILDICNLIIAGKIGINNQVSGLLVVFDATSWR